MPVSLTASWATGTASGRGLASLIAPSGVCHAGAQGQGHPAAGRRELDGVGDEVVAGLAEADGVTGDDDAVLGHVDDDLDAGARRR